MQRFLIPCALAIVLLLCRQTPTQAQDILHLADKADVICVATYKSIKRIDGEQVKQGDLDHWRSFYAVTLQVQALWKGALPQPELTLKTSNVERDGPHFPFTPFQPNRNHLIFAKKEAGSALYVSADPTMPEVFRTYVAVGGVPGEITPNTPLLTRIFLQLLNTLSDQDAEVRKNAVGLFAMDYLFWDQAPPVASLPPGIDYVGLRKFYEARVIPEVLRLTQDEDEETRMQALETASWIQVTKVIPDIVKIAESDSRFAESMCWALFHYRTKAAAPLLLPLLKNYKLKTRVPIVEYFEVMKDRRSVPYLLEILDDPDAQVRQRVVFALWYITGLPTTYRIAMHLKSEKEYIAFWKDWATTHADELNRLRRQ